MDLKKYKYIKNVKPKFDAGKSGFSPTDPTRSSLLSGAIGPKTPDLSNLTSALNPTNTVSNIANTAIPSSLQQSTLSNVGLGTKLKAGLGLANKAIGAVSNFASPIMGGINAVKSIANAFSTKGLSSVDDLSNNAGSSEGSVNGVSYEKMNNVDGKEAMKEVDSTSGVIGAATSTASFGASVAGPVGGLVGGLIGGIAGIFGGNRRKRAMERRIREAKRLNERVTSYNRSAANTQALERDYYEDNEDNTGDILYANKGKDMNKVWTPTGYRNGHINSMVGKGESIVNFNRGTGILITKGHKGVDNQPSSVKPGDSNVILGNDVDWTNGMKFSDQAAPYTAMLQTMNDYTKTPEKYSKMSSLSKQTQGVQERELNRRKQPIMDALASISARQQKQHQIENKVASGAFYDDGKDKFNYLWTPQNPMNVSLESFNNSVNNGTAPYMVMRTAPKSNIDNSTYTKIDAPVTSYTTSNNKNTNDSGSKDIIPTWMRMLPSAYGMLQSINQYNRYANQKPARTNTYRSNPYAREALRGLASLRYDIYPELQAIRDAERRGNYGIMNQGGLTAGQRAASRIANTIATQRNLAETYANASNQNNKYKQQYYTTLMNAGQADRTAKMSALQQDYENYARAHGAKYKGMDVATANKIDQLNNWFANEFKYRTYKDTADIYRQQLSQSEKDLVNNYTGSKATVNNPVVTTTPVSFRTTVLPDYSQKLADQYNSFMNPYNVPVWGNPLDFSFKNLKKYATV